MAINTQYRFCAATGVEQMTAQAATLILHRASLIELRDALKDAKRWSNAASVATLNAEINRRLGVCDMQHVLTAN